MVNGLGGILKAFAALSLLIPATASTEATVPFASKTWGLRIVELTNPGTSNAVLTARISTSTAREYCDRNPRGETIGHGRKMAKAQCVRRLLAKEGTRTYTFKANCQKRSIRIHGSWFTLLRQNRDGDMLWREVATNRTLGTDGADNHGVHNLQYRALCPGARVTD